MLPLVFGESIKPYCYLLLPIVAFSLATAYVWFVNDLLVALRSFKGSFIGNTVALAASIPFTFPLVDCFGMNGVSFAGIVAFGISAVVMTLFLLPHLTGRSTSYTRGED